MDILEQVYQQSLGGEKIFTNKKVLFIGSESYDAAVISVIEGLEELGFEIYTIKKPNINSWFCNKIIDNPNQFTFDFVLSCLHWGTRWSYYKRYNLNHYVKVLIDGDDNLGWKTWQDKYAYYVKHYRYNPPEEIKKLEIAPYRWVESLDGYNPDVVFTSQKQFKDINSFYLPFGIHKQYYSVAQNKDIKERDFDFTHIPGPGRYRDRMIKLLKICRKFKIIPGRISNEVAYGRGNDMVSEKIREYIVNDDNVHSWHRWIIDRVYFNLLNNSKVLVYPGIDHWPIWESKRPWEAYASGCLVLMSKPRIDVSEYPLTKICEYAVYHSYVDFIKKCRFLYKNPEVLDEYRIQACLRAKKYFTAKPIANYFLEKIAQNV